MHIADAISACGNVYIDADAHKHITWEHVETWLLLSLTHVRERPSDIALYSSSERETRVRGREWERGVEKPTGHTGQQ